MRFTLTASLSTLDELEAFAQAAREAGAYDGSTLGDTIVLELEWECP